MFVLIIHFLLVNATVYRGITRPLHNQTHVMIIISTFFLPFISWDFSQLGNVPDEAWVLCGFYTSMQIIHTLFHIFRPNEVHANGPEILFQPIICIWATSLRVSIDSNLWYRGWVGPLFFCAETIFVSLSVLMTIYMGELTSATDDEIDFFKYPIYSKSNAAFLTAAPSSLLVTLFVAFREPLSPLFLLASALVFAFLRKFVPPRANVQPRGSAAVSLTRIDASPTPVPVSATNLTVAPVVAIDSAVVPVANTEAIAVADVPRVDSTPISAAS